MADTCGDHRVDKMGKQPGKRQKSGNLIRVDEDAFVPEQYVDEDGDLLVYDGSGCWIAKNDKGEVVKKVKV